MKKITLLCMCLFFGALSFAQKQQQRSCLSMENLEYRKKLDPTLQQRMDAIETNFQKRLSEKGNYQSRVDGDVITIPVVVHVIYSNNNENISDAQIISQIDVLNEDFRRTNSDADNTWSQAADTEIEFALATVGPDGSATTGITRKSSSVTEWGTNDNMKRSSSGGVDPWDTSEYLNMWVCNIGDGLLGYAQFPGGSASTDGVVMGPNYFGSSDKGSGFYLSAPFDKGRTTTHEVGHFLDAENYGCATGHTSCGSLDMVENYMDYSDDSCMNLFTEGQTTRMRTILEAGGSRRSLALSDKFGVGVEPTCTDGIQNGDETGVDCGGSSCEPCVVTCESEGGFTLNITFDNYPEETSWALTSGNTTIASESYTTSNADGSTVTESFNLTSGDYEFTINDAYGDGICCSYGNGSYELSSPDGVLVSGGSFGSSETTTFCVDGGATVSPVFPDVTKKYYIDSAHFNYRVAATGESEEPYTTDKSTTGEDVEWVFVDKGNGYWHIQRAAGGTLPRLRTDNSQFADMQGTAWSGSYTYYELTEGYYDDSYFVTLPDGPSSYRRLQINNSGVVRMVSEASALTWESITFTEVGSAKVSTSARESVLSTLKVSPVPLRSGTPLNVSLSNNEGVSSYTIVNTLGQILDKGVLNQSSISTDKLTPGMYILNVSNSVSNATETARFIVK